MPCCQGKLGELAKKKQFTEPAVQFILSLSNSDSPSPRKAAHHCNLERDSATLDLYKEILGDDDQMWVDLLTYNLFSDSDEGAGDIGPAPRKYLSQLCSKEDASISSTTFIPLRALPVSTLEEGRRIRIIFDYSSRTHVVRVFLAGNR